MAPSNSIQKLENELEKRILSSQYPRAAIWWTGELEDAKSVHELITSAPITRKPIPDFENLDFKIASGLAMAFSIAGVKILQKMWEGPYWEGVWPCLDPWDVERLRTSSWNVPRKYLPHGELFFFIKTEPFALTEAVQFKPFVPAETLKACALVGLHPMAAAGESGSSGSPCPDLGDMWRHGLAWTHGMLNRKIPHRTLQETSHHSRRQSSIGEEITYRQTDCLDDLRLFKIRGDIEAILDFRRTTTFRPSTLSGMKYYQQSLTAQLTACWRVCTRCKLKSRKT